MITLKPLEHVGYAVKKKGTKKYMMEGYFQIIDSSAWGTDLAKIEVFKTIEDAQALIKHWDTCKKDFHNIKDIKLEIELIHKKDVMVAKLKGSKDE